MTECLGGNEALAMMHPPTSATGSAGNTGPDSTCTDNTAPDSTGAGSKDTGSKGTDSTGAGEGDGSPGDPGPSLDRAAAAVTALCVVLCAIAGVAVAVSGYRAIGDWASIATRSMDVGTANTPLLGTRSSVPPGAGAAIMHHPGPMQFFLLAPFVRLFGEAGLPLGAAVWLAVSIVAFVLMCGRGWGSPGRAGGALASLFLVSTFGVAQVGSAWPPIMIIAPAAVVIIAVWPAINGDRFAWLGMAVASSFVVQTNLAAAPIVLVAVAIAAVGLVWRTFARRRGQSQNGALTDESVGASGAVGSTVGLAGGVALFLWLPPLIEQLTDAHPNMTAVLRNASGSGAVFGIGRGVSTSMATLSGPLGWAGSRFDRPWIGGVDLGFGDVGTFAPWPLVVAGLALVVVVMALWWRSGESRSDSSRLVGTHSSGSAVIVGSMVSTAVVLARVPFADGFLSLGWIRWMWAPAVVVAALVLTAIMSLTPDRSRRAVIGLLAAVALLPALWTSNAGVDELHRVRGEGRAVTDIERVILRSTTSASDIVLRYDFGGASITPTIVRELEDRGHRVYTEPVAPKALLQRVLVFGDERRAPRPSDAPAGSIAELSILYVGGPAQTVANPNEIVACGTLPLIEARELYSLRARIGSLDEAETARHMQLESRTKSSGGLDLIVVFSPAR